MTRKHKTNFTDDIDQEDNEIALFAGGRNDDVLYDRVEYHEDLENLHPAEVAARYQPNQKGPVGESDEQILKDLRKLVFSVPLLHQEEVTKIFFQIDKCIFPTVFKILDTSITAFEDVLQVIIKIIAGNTYGKNIYEKDADHREEEENRNTEIRGTYKAHEIRFLENSYELFLLFAIKNTPACKDNFNISTKYSMQKCNFIRGIYEDLLSSFVTNILDYEELHWQAVEAKAEFEYNKYYTIIEDISILDKKFKMNKYSFYIVREAKRIYTKYMQLRAVIVTPYLRTVYSIAKSTAKNSHQMLDNFQNGSIGLMRAVSCYSTKRKANFSSVAKWWIRQTMLLSIKEDANFVKLPVSTWQAYTQLEKAKVKCGANDEDVKSIALAAKMPYKKAKSVYQTVKISQVYSLNRTYDSDEKLTLEDIMTDEDRLGSIADPFGDLLRDYCESAKLSTLELKVLALRHGMLDLVKHNKPNRLECYKEALVQNLALLGYNYIPNL